MRTVFILLAMCLGEAPAAEKAFGFNVTYKEIKEPREIIGKWSFSGQWAGCMGMAIEFKEHEFRYWFRSDMKLPDEPKYPIVGKWEIVKGVVELKAIDGERSLYSDKWVMTKFKDSVGLTNPGDVTVLIWHQSSPETRMLTKVDGEPPIWPMLNTPGAWRESAQDAPKQPATRPESKPKGNQEPQPKSVKRSRQRVPAP